MSAEIARLAARVEYLEEEEARLDDVVEDLKAEIARLKACRECGKPVEDSTLDPRPLCSQCW